MTRPTQISPREDMPELSYSAWFGNAVLYVAKKEDWPSGEPGHPVVSALDYVALKRRYEALLTATKKAGSDGPDGERT